MRQAKVSISIPTYNSAIFLKKCLEAIAQQSYANIEVNIVDGESHDGTVAIAREHGVKNIFTCKDALLSARFEGVWHSKGDFVLLLDSDQILNKSAIARAVQLCEKEDFDMLVLEEGVYNPQSFIERLFQQDRKLIHQVKDFSPFTGVVLPRFYRKSLLLKAMKNIPEETRKAVGGQDHAIIYFEAWNISQKVGFLPDAVLHIEPNSLKTIWKKFYRWGGTSVGARYGKYDEMLNKKERFRTGLFKKGLMRESLASILLLILKGVPYKLGYYRAKLSTK